MFYQKLKLYSSLGNKLKKLNEVKYPDKFVENKSYSYLDENGEKIKLEYEIEREKRLFNQFIQNMTNYKKLEEGRKKNYFSKLKGYKDLLEEKKIEEQRKKRFQDIIELKKRRNLLYENKLPVNYRELASNIKNYLIEEKTQNNNFITKEMFHTDKDNIYKKIILKNNQKTFLSLNSSLNSENYNSNGKKMKFLETNNYNLMPKIIRKRIHGNKSTNDIIDSAKKLNLFDLKIKKSQTVINPQIYSQKETNYSNLVSNENNSFNLNLNSTSNMNKKINSVDNNKIKNIKSFVNKYNFIPNNIQVYGTKVKWKKRLKIKKPLTLEKIKDTTNNSNNKIEAREINTDRISNDYPFSISSNISNAIKLTNPMLGMNRRPIKLKKINSIRSRKLMNYIMNNFTNSKPELDKELKTVKEQNE